jgi:hypothetical protein
MTDRLPGMVTDPDEVARFAVERDQDIAAEHRLLLGQMVVLVGVIVVAIALASLGR